MDVEVAMSRVMRKIIYIYKPCEVGNIVVLYLLYNEINKQDTGAWLRNISSFRHREGCLPPAQLWPSILPISSSPQPSLLPTSFMHA